VQVGRLQTQGASDMAWGHVPLSTVGMIIADGARCEWQAGGTRICYQDVGGTVALGNTIITSRNSLSGTLIADEESHSNQSAILGNELFLLVWSGGWIASQFDPRYAKVGGGGCWKVIEYTATRGAGYEGPCGW